MKAGDHNLQSNFQTISLKRDKQDFLISTFSTAQTLHKVPFHQNNNPQQVRKNNIKQRQTQQIQTTNKMPSKTHQDKISNLADIDPNPIYFTLTKLINQQRQSHPDPSRIPNHRTHCYRYIGSQTNQPISNYHINYQQHFPPKLIKQLYNKKQQNLIQQNINYHFGHLPKIGYLYFSIQNTLVFINSLSYIQPQQHQQPITLQLPDHVLSISQVLISDLQIDNMQRHPFAQKKTILMFWSQWQIAFYSFQPHGLNKVVDLNIRHLTSCQMALYFDYCKKGNLYYMNEEGQIGKLDLFHQSAFYHFTWGRKFSIREYFYRFNNNTKRKRQKLINPNIFSKAKQFYEDAKYFFSEKKTKGLSIICDRQRNLLYTLVQTSTYSASQNRQQNESHRQIRMYGISTEDNLNIFQKFQRELSYNAPRILTQLTQQKLYSEIGTHLFNNLSLMKFQISAIYVPHYFDVALEQYAHNKSNLIVILSNGSRLYLYLNQNTLILNQIINLPNLDELLALSRRNPKNQQLTLSQKQPTGFRLIEHQLHLQDKTLAIIGQYRRNIISLLFTQILGQQYRNQQQVLLVWYESLDQDNRGDLTPSIFANPSDYHIYLTPQLSPNIYKTKLTQYKYNQLQTIPITQNYHPQHLNKNANKQQIVKINTIKENPQNRQILHSPQQYLIINKQQLLSIIKLRPIDTIFSTLHQQLTTYTQSNISNLLYNQFNLNQLYSKILSNLNLTPNVFMDVLIMLVQIFSDVYGIYYFQYYSNNFVQRNPKQLSKASQIALTTRITANSILQTNNFPTYQRRADQTLTLNNYGINSRTNQQAIEIDPPRSRPTQKKINTINTFFKYSYADMNLLLFNSKCSKEKQQTFKTKQINTILKLVIKLMLFITKHPPNQSQNYSYLQKQNQQTNSSLHHQKLSPKHLQLAILTYLSRLLVVLWSLKITTIERFVYQYIIDVSHKILDLLHELQAQLLTLSTPSPFTPLRNLFKLILQYNTMLSLVSSPPNLNYGQGLGTRKQLFEQSLFFSIQKQKNISHTVNQWRQLIPNYFNLTIFKAIKLQSQIAQIADKKAKKSTILKNYQSMPPYLLSCYFRDGTLSQLQIQTILDQTNNQYKTTINNTNYLFLTDSMTSYDKVQYAISESCKNDRNLTQKLFLITHALQNINYIRNLQTQQLLKKKNQLLNLQKIIRIQQLMYKQLLKYDKTGPQPPQQAPTSKTLLNYYLLTPSQLKPLLLQLKNPTIQLIYYCNFYDQDINPQKNLQLLLAKHNNTLKAAQIKEKLQTIFKFISNHSALQKLPFKYLLNLLDQLSYHEIAQQQLNWIIHQNNQQFIKQKFWVPLFLSQWGWNQQTLLDYYIQQSTKQYKSYQLLSTQKLFLYYWLSGYCLVKFRYLSARHSFEIANQQIVGCKYNKKQTIYLQSNTNILMQFMKINLYSVINT